MHLQSQQESPISRDKCWIKVTNKRTIAGNVLRQEQFFLNLCLADRDPGPPRLPPRSESFIWKMYVPTPALASLRMYLLWQDLAHEGDFPLDSGRELFREIILIYGPSLSKYPASFWWASKVHGQPSLVSDSEAAKNFIRWKSLVPVCVCFTLSSTNADGRTLISPFRGFRRRLQGSANTNLT